MAETFLLYKWSFPQDVEKAEAFQVHSYLTILWTATASALPVVWLRRAQSSRCEALPSGRTSPSACC